MNDTQFYIVTSVVGAGLGSIGLAIRFAARRVVKALDASSQALLENTKSNAVLSTKIDSIANFVRDQTPRFKRPKTNPQGTNDD